MPSLPRWNYETRVNESPHVVILGAGASLASFPHGDKNGIKLPLMTNLIETIHLNDLLNETGVRYEGHNFEDVYNDLYHDNYLDKQKTLINNRIYNYFSDIHH